MVANAAVYSLDHTDATPRCIACGGSFLRKKFSVPLVDGPYRNKKPITNREMYECDECGHLSTNLYDRDLFKKYYESISVEDYYDPHDADHSRYQRILSTVSASPVKRVLDIGCGTGTFLSLFPSGVERFGIEPSRPAADRAREKGIKIIGASDLQNPQLNHTFDLVTAIDVVEHTNELQLLRRQLAQALRPGGTLVLLTGDVDSLAAKALGRFWYYINYSEHVSMFSRRSMRQWLESEFADIQITAVDHHRVNVRDTLTVLRGWTLFPVKWALREVFRVPRKFYTTLWLPGDHMLVLAKRSGPPLQELT